MLEFRLDLRLGQGQNNTRLSIIILGQHPTGQQSHNSFGTLLRILPLPLTEHFMLPAGHREPGKSQGDSCTASMGF